MKKTIFILFASILLNCDSNIEVDYEVLRIESANKLLIDNGYINSKIFENKFKTELNKFETKTLNKLLNFSFNTYNLKHPNYNTIDILDYKFFYIPTLDNQNKKWIFIYGICKNKTKTNAEFSEFFLVDDGGSCYIQSVINLTDKVEGWIVTNSRA